MPQQGWRKQNGMNGESGQLKTRSLPLEIEFENDHSRFERLPVDFKLVVGSNSFGHPFTLSPVHPFIFSSVAKNPGNETPAHSAPSTIVSPSAISPATANAIAMRWSP
jgi:hypothetical protein